MLKVKTGKNEDDKKRNLEIVGNKALSFDDDKESGENDEKESDERNAKNGQQNQDNQSSKGKNSVKCG